MHVKAFKAYPTVVSMFITTLITLCAYAHQLQLVMVALRLFVSYLTSSQNHLITMACTFVTPTTHWRKANSGLNTNSNLITDQCIDNAVLYSSLLMVQRQRQHSEVWGARRAGEILLINYS